MIDIYADGACKGTGDGGWGVAIYENQNLIHSVCDGEQNTTNNRMELLAFIAALQCIHDMKLKDVTVYSDSMYVVKGVNEWLYNWRLKDYSGVKNDDLWRRIANANFIWKDINIKHIKGHSGNKGNDMADKLANEGVLKGRGEDTWMTSKM